MVRLPHAPHDHASLPNIFCSCWHYIVCSGGGGEDLLQRSQTARVDGGNLWLLAESGRNGDGAADACTGDKANDCVISFWIGGREVWPFETEMGVVAYGELLLWRS